MFKLSHHPYFEQWIDPDTGVHNPFTHRIWWLRRDGTEFEPLHPVQRVGLQPYN